MSATEASRKFHFIREIASGGFGSVYLAKVVHPDGFSRLAAIKLLHPRWSENEEITKRMRDEARLLGWLRHKHIVDVIDLTLIDGRCAVIMEYLEAVDAKVVVNALAEQGHLMPLRVALEACAAVASALDAAYNRPPFPGEKPLRVIHRDIKPSNLMIDGTGTVKVLDFGVARAEFDAREAKTQELSFGSLEYMPPERLFFEPESPASDVYSLGATLYELLALEKFGKAKLRQADQERHIEDRFDALLEKHPLPSEEIEDVLHDLLWDMLAFEETDRPSAGDCVTRMRTFARRLSEEGLEEWSERVIPPLVRRFQGGPRSSEGADLVDRIITEDTGGFDHRMGAYGEVQDVAMPLPPSAPQVPDDVGPPPPVAPPPQNRSITPATRRPPASVEPPLSPGETPTVIARVEDFTRLEAHAEPVAPPPPPPGPVPPPAPVAAPPEPEEEAGSGGALRYVLIAVLLLVGIGALSFGGLGLLGIVGVGTYTVVVSDGIAPVSGDDAPVSGEGPAPAEPPAEAEPEEEPQPAFVEGEGVRFVSELPGTRRMTVRCDAGQGQGVADVVIPGADHESCTVTAIGDHRKRLTAVVKPVEPREYTCFAGEENVCR